MHLFSSISNSQNSMVQKLTGAVRIIVDSTFVELEGVLTSVNPHRYGSNSCYCLLQIGFTSSWHICPGGDSCSHISCVEDTLSVHGGVRIGGLSVNALVDDGVVEGLVHEAALATVVTLGLRAIHKILLRQGHKLASLFEVLSLHGSGGAESPARATLLLIFDGSHIPLAGPVHLLGHVSKSIKREIR